MKGQDMQKKYDLPLLKDKPGKAIVLFIILSILYYHYYNINTINKYIYIFIYIVLWMNVQISRDFVDQQNNFF